MQRREQDIVVRVLGGRVEEFGYFIDSYGDMVFALVRDMVGSEPDAEELTQDAFVKAYRHLGSFDGQARFSTWLCRIAYRLAIDHLRRRRHAPPLSDIPEERWVDVDESEVDVLMGEADNRRMELLEQAIDMLAPNERTLVQLFYYEGRSLAEAAYITLGDSGKQSTVSSQLCRIRKKLHYLITRMEHGT